MASNRFAPNPRPVAHVVPNETAKDAIATIARHTARIQIAAFGAAGNAFAGWARAADQLAQNVGDALLRRIDGECDSRDLIVRVASATNAHLHDLTALPSAATNHFDTRLARVSNDS